jgi:dTDP-4-dehydrorhamnose reductase
MPVILVTGGSGQLAQALRRAAGTVADLGSLVVVGRPTLDFDRPDSIAEVVRAHAPALVINAAAWTAVDAAEAEPEAAARANAAGPGTMARICDETGSRLLHLSTDYVYDGLKGAPYVETDLPRPTGVYGQTKLAGERAVLDALPGAVVLRTSWVYAETGRNFVLTMLNAARRLPELRVVADQQGCPTNADDLAHAVLGVARRMLADPDGSTGGVYHAAGTGAVTWHGFAEAIFDCAAEHGRSRPVVQAIATADWPTPARRPPDSRLDCTRLADVFGVRLPDWQPSLRRAVSAICAAQP